MRPLYNWLFSMRSEQHKEPATFPGLYSETIGSETTSDDTWPLNGAMRDSVARPYMAIEISSMHDEGAIKFSKTSRSRIVDRVAIEYRQGVACGCYPVSCIIEASTDMMAAKV